MDIRKSNGEKTSPAPLEAILKASEDVSDALVFGSNKSAVGAAIIPAFPGIRPENIFPILTRANASAPAHSQIQRELLVLLPSDATFPRASKGTLQRGRAYQAFAHEIDTAYEHFEKASDASCKAKLSLKGISLLQYLQRIVADALNLREGKQVGVDDDLFNEGLNSLQSVRIRNVVQKV